MKLQTDEFRRAFEIVDLVELNSSVNSTRFVKLVHNHAALRFSMTGLCIAESCVKTSGRGSWTFYVDRKSLAAFVDTTTVPTIDLVVQDGSLTLQAGDHKTTFMAMAPISGYSHWNPTSEKLQRLKITDGLRNDLKCLSDYAEPGKVADHLSAVYLIEKYGILATDQFVVAACLDPALSATFPLPVALSKLVARKARVATLEVEKIGAAIRFPEGYLYQPISARCGTDYPIRKVQGAVKESQNLKPLMKVKAGELKDAIVYLQAFIFGPEINDAVIHCQNGENMDSILLRLRSVRGEVQITLPGEISTNELRLKWLVPRVTPWVEYMAELDREAPIYCGCDPKTHCTVLRSTHGTRQFVLVMADWD